MAGHRVLLRRECGVPGACAGAVLAVLRGPAVRRLLRPAGGAGHPGRAQQEHQQRRLPHIPGTTPHTLLTGP